MSSFAATVVGVCRSPELPTRSPIGSAIVVYIDALIPRDGQSGLELLPEPFVDLLRCAAAEYENSWRVAIPPELLPPQGLIPEEERAHYVERLQDQPLETFTEPLVLTGAADQEVSIRCLRNLRPRNRSVRALDRPVEVAIHERRRIP